MHLLIVRHGECQGQIDPTCTTPDSELTTRGQQQVAQTARRLADTGITQILSSPLLRALATATALAAVLSCGPVQVWTELREGWSGPAYCGWSRARLQQDFANTLLPAEITEQGWHHGGDTYESMVARGQQIAQRLRRQFTAEQRIVLVTHGGIGNYLLHALLQIAPSTPQWFQLENCSISEVRLVSPESQSAWPLYPIVQTQVLSINDCAHLANHQSG